LLVASSVRFGRALGRHTLTNDDDVVDVGARHPFPEDEPTRRLSTNQINDRIRHHQLGPTPTVTWLINAATHGCPRRVDVLLRGLCALERLVTRHSAGHHLSPADVRSMLDAAATIQPNELLSSLDASLHDAMLHQPTPGDAGQAGGGDAPIQIRVLGRFEVTVGGAHLEAIPGKAGELLAMLAVAATPMPIDLAVDALWPDAELMVGQRRLRNVVSRLRKNLGSESAVVRQGALLRLGCSVSTDAFDFRRAADRAELMIRRHEPGAREAVIAALDVYGGPLLPTHLYEEWACDARILLHSRSLSLLQSFLNLQHNSVDATWQLQTATRLAVDDPDTYATIARQAAAQGDLHTVKAATDLACHFCEQLGLHAAPYRSVEPG
jgi:DNA-binding SARP family transcriptional activator